MLEPRHITLNGTEYCIGRLDMFQALDVVRLAGPSLPVLFSSVIAGVMKMLHEQGEEPALDQVAVALASAQPVLERVAAMPQADFRQLVSTCLSCVERRGTDKRFFSVLVNGVPQDDFPAADALVLTLHVLVREIRPIGAALFNLESVGK